MAGVVKIDFKIGGADAVARAISTVLKSSERAIRQSTQNEQKANRERVSGAAGASRSVIAEQRKVASEQRRMEREAVAVVRQANREKVQEERRASAEVVAVVRQANREKMAEERKLENEKRRADNRAKNRAEQNAKERGRLLGGMVGGGVSGAAHGVATLGRGAGALIRGGMGLAGSLMGGLGVEAGLGRAVHVGTERQKLATNLVNASLSGPEAENVSMVERQKRAAELGNFAKDIGGKTAMDPNKILEGMGAFVGKTGDLQTAKEAMGELAVLSRATGSSVEDMASAAGDVSANLGDMKNKGQMVTTIMRVFAGQGKLGAVEVKDLSKQMAGLAAQTTMFAAGPETAMASLGALTQEARQGGGAKSAAQSVTSVESFVNTFSKGARLGNFEKHKVAFKNEKGLLDPEEIIVNALKATGGDNKKMGELFADVRARSATKGFESIYRSAGGGEAGEKAVRAKFSELRGATLGKGDEAAAFAASMQTAEAKAQLFQQRLDQIAGDMADKLMPAFLKLTPALENMVPVVGKFIDSVTPHADELASALVRLAPVAGKAADALATLITFAVDHPVLAGGAVVGGSALQGGASALLGAAAQGLLGSSTTLGTAGTSMIASAGQLGAAAALLAGIHFGGRKVINKTMEEVDTLSGNQGEATNLASKLRRGKGTAEDKKEAEGKAGRFELMGGNFFERFAGANNETLDRVSKDGATPESLLRLIASPVTSALTAGVSGGDVAKEGANDAARELRQAIAESNKMPDAAEMGAAMAGPIADAVGAAVGAANAQNPKVQPP